MSVNDIADKLPEKLYFSVDEIKQRWDCATDQVIHYMAEGLIRPAIIATEISGLELFDMVLAIQNETQQGRRFSAESWSDCVNLVSKETALAALITACKHEVGKFLYIVPKHVAHAGAQTVVSVLEDFQFKEYGLVDLMAPDRPARHDISKLIIREQPHTYLANHYIYSWNPTEVIITREERDRFEQTHGIGGISVGMLTEYTTPYLEVMHQAIANFFAPRHSVDARREEVEDWIAERLEAAGTEGSKRIAGAMFTMIKPSDHNPRKRRG